MSDDGPNTQGTVLVADDDRGLCVMLATWLRREGYAVEVVHNGEDCLDVFRRLIPDVICLDVHMPGLDGLQTLERLKQTDPHLPVIMLTSDTAVDNVVSAMSLGAYDYQSKPVDKNRFVTTIRNAVERHLMAMRLAQLEREAQGGGYEGIIGQSARMRDVFRQLDRIVASDITVLIHGESGTGKELIARAIHERSGRRKRPFVAVNCAAVPEGLQESEFFGHEKGAFTGASARKAGRFEQAHEGTLFLDELGELSQGLQAKLLRVLQERSFQRVGGTREIVSDFRLVAATHRRLSEMVAAGTFREDLYFRVAVFELELPPLRERAEDIALLAQRFALELSGGKAIGFDEDALIAMTEYAWPGNVRQLRNAIERALVLTPNDRIDVEHLPQVVREDRQLFTVHAAAAEPAVAAAPSLPAAPAPAGPPPAPNDSQWALPLMSLSDIEKLAILNTYERCKGNISEVARVLEVGRSTLYRKFKKYGIDI